MASVIISTATALLAELADSGNVLLDEDADALADEIRGLVEDAGSFSFQRQGSGSRIFSYRAGEMEYAKTGRRGPLCLFLEGTNDVSPYFTPEGGVDYRFTSGTHLRPAMITVAPGTDHSTDLITVQAQPVCMAQLILNFCQKVIARNADRPRVTSAGAGYEVDGLISNIQKYMKQVQGVTSI